MRALAALAALHVILAYPDGECDDVGMLQSSFSHAKETAAIQISAMVHGGKHKGEPEAQHSAESASAKDKPAEEKSPQPAEEKPSQLAEEKSPQPTEEKPSQLAEEKPAEEKSPQSAEEKPAEEKSPQSAEEKPAEEKSPQPTEEKPSQLAEEKPAEEKSSQLAEEDPAEEKSPQSAEEKPAEEKSSQLAEEEPAEEKSPQSAEEKPVEEKSSQLAEEEPAEEKSPQSAEEKPAEEKSSQSAEEKPAEEKSPQSAEEKEAAEMQKKFKPLKEIAMVLAKTKYHCKVLGDQRCLPMLKEYRRKAWPFLQKELGKNLTMFGPKGPQGMRNRWRPFFVKTRLQGCMEHPVIYMQVNGVKAKTLAMNLRKHSRPGAIKTGHIEKKEICRATKNKKTVGVTFVRDPLARFTSAYGELMAARRRQPNMANGSDAALLEEDEKSSTEHARLFVENFLQGGGKDVTAAILPQAEYFAERSHNCSARMSFIGKSESPAQEWRRMIHDMDCDPTKIPYLNGTRAAKANKTSLSLLQLSNGATSSMQKALKLDGGAYLRAWCWFSMPDYVLLDYDLPTACLETDMGMIIDWAWTWKVVPPSPKKNTATEDAEHEDTEHEDKEFETI